MKNIIRISVNRTVSVLSFNIKDALIRTILSWSSILAIHKNSRYRKQNKHLLQYISHIYVHEYVYIYIYTYTFTYCAYHTIQYSKIQHYAMQCNTTQKIHFAYRLYTIHTHAQSCYYCYELCGLVTSSQPINLCTFITTLSAAQYLP